MTTNDTVEEPPAASSSTALQPIPVNPTKLAKNPRLPATMITSGGQVQPSQKNKKNSQMSKKKRAKLEKGREKAVELSSKLEVKMKEREGRKEKRQKAKRAWE
nr:hypothetical protein L204_02343 [Cryptococcus depauperatus CBS 7855]